MIKYLSQSWRALAFVVPLAGIVGVGIAKWPEDGASAPEKTPHAQTDEPEDTAVKPVTLQLPEEFKQAGEILDNRSNYLPPLPAQEILNDYAFGEGSIPLNPFLIKALEEDPQAREYLRMIKSACAEHDLDWRLCANQIFRESNHFNKDVVNGTQASNKGAIGIAQFKPSTALEEYGVPQEDLTDPQKALSLYAQHMADLRAEYDGDVTLALIAYNGGRGAVFWISEELKNPDATGEDVLAFLEKRFEELGNKSPHAYHVETRNYTKEILGLSEQEHPEWAKSQNELFNNGYFIAGLLNEGHVLSAWYPTGVEIEAPATSIRPKPRPDSILASFDP